MKITTFAFALALLISSGVAALEVRFQPGEVIYVYENWGEGSPTDLYTAVIQNVGIVHTGSGSIVVDQAWVEAYKDEVLTHRELVSNQALALSAKTYNAYQEQGALEAYDFHFQTSRYLKGFKLPPDLTLSNNQAILVKGWALLLHGQPDRIEVRVEGRDETGDSVSSSGSLRVINHESENVYNFPLMGRWVAAAAPSLHNHHRWASIQEFALDLIQFGADSLTHRGDGSELSQYYAYGKPITAVADGVVLRASDGMEEANDNLRQPNESAGQYEERMMVDQQTRLAKGFAFAMGNHLVIQHPNKEYSHYAHLKNGSITVNVGDRVTAGQHIAALGHSGNSTEPHLHFHMTDGPDIDYSRSIPVAFHNIELFPADNGAVRHIHSGQIVIASP